MLKLLVLTFVISNTYALDLKSLGNTEEAVEKIEKKAPSPMELEKESTLCNSKFEVKMEAEGQVAKPGCKPQKSKKEVDFKNVYQGEIQTNGETKTGRGL